MVKRNRDSRKRRCLRRATHQNRATRCRCRSGRCRLQNILRRERIPAPGKTGGTGVQLLRKAAGALALRRSGIAVAEHQRVGTAHLILKKRAEIFTVGRAVCGIHTVIFCFRTASAASLWSRQRASTSESFATPDGSISTTSGCTRRKSETSADTKLPFSVQQIHPARSSCTV